MGRGGRGCGCGCGDLLIVAADATRRCSKTALLIRLIHTRLEFTFLRCRNEKHRKKKSCGAESDRVGQPGRDSAQVADARSRTSRRLAPPAEADPCLMKRFNKRFPIQNMELWENVSRRGDVEFHGFQPQALRGMPRNSVKKKLVKCDYVCQMVLRLSNVVPLVSAVPTSVRWCSGGADSERARAPASTACARHQCAASVHDMCGMAPQKARKVRAVHWQHEANP